MPYLYDNLYDMKTLPWIFILITYVAWPQLHMTVVLYKHVVVHLP